MTNYRARAAEIREAAAAERGNFEPSGAPKRIYSYWLKHSRTVRATNVKLGIERENFCHFWRVVAIWAPLMFVKRGVMRVLNNKYFQIALSILALVVMVFVITTAGGWKHLLIGLAIAVGIIVVGGLLIAAGMKINDFVRAHWKDSWNSVVEKVFLGFMGISMAVLIIVALVGIVQEFGWLGLAIVAGAIVAVSAIIAVFAGLANYLAGKRAIAKEQARKERYDYLYEHGEFPPVAPREPGKVSKFFTSLADMLIFAMQIVRVKKWKICPMVEIDNAV